MDQKFEISFSALLKMALLILFIVFAYFIRDILLLVFLALIIASAVNAPVRWLRKYHIPRVLAVIMVYVVGIAILALMFALVIPPLANELKQLASFLPKISERLAWSFEAFKQYATENQNEIRDFLFGLSQRLNQLRVNLFAITGNVISGFAAIIVTFVVSFYLALDEEGIKKFLHAIVPKKHENYALRVWERTQKNLGRWLGAQLLLGFVIGLLTFIALKILGLPYALALAILAGLLEMIPFVGPILASIPAILIAFIKSPLLALLTVAVYIIIQQTEGNILVPKVMQKTVGINPVVAIIVILIGAKFAGIVGVLLAIPTTMLLAEFGRGFFEKRPGFHKIK